MSVSVVSAINHATPGMDGNGVDITTDDALENNDDNVKDYIEVEVGSMVPEVSERTTTTPSAVIRRKILRVPKTLVAAPEPLPAAYDGRIFTTVGKNNSFQVQPPIINFDGFKLNKTHRIKVRLLNTSPSVRRCQFLNPTTSYFNIIYANHKKSGIYSGMAEEVIVEFTPTEHRYYSDCLRILCEDDENLLVPIHAFHVLANDAKSSPNSIFPNRIEFGRVPVADSRTKVIPIYSNVPADFEFRIHILRSHSSFHIEPLSGTVPAEGCGNVEIHVTFSPIEYITASMVVELHLSQFGFKPILCELSGYSKPETRSVQPNVKIQTEECILKNISHQSENSPLARRYKRRKDVSNDRKTTGTSSVKKHMTADGLLVPDDLNNPASVVSVLLQRPGRMRIRDIRAALSLGKDDTGAISTIKTGDDDAGPGAHADEGKQLDSRHVREVLFEQELRKLAEFQRRKELHWFVCIGEDPMTEEMRRDILTARAKGEASYPSGRQNTHTITPSVELARRELRTRFKRTMREAYYRPLYDPTFDPYLNLDWSMREFALKRFVQAARTIIIRYRIETRLSCVREFFSLAGPNPTREDIALLVSHDVKRAAGTHRNKMRNSNAKGGTEEKRTTTAMSVHSEGSAASENAIVAASGASNSGSGTGILDRPTVNNIEQFAFPSEKAEESMVEILNGSACPVRALEVPVAPLPLFQIRVPQYYRMCGYSPHNERQALRYVPLEKDRTFRSGALDELAVRGDIGVPKLIDSNVMELLEKTAPPQLETPPSFLGNSNNSLGIGVAMLGTAVRYPVLHLFNPLPTVHKFSYKRPFGELAADYHLCPLNHQHDSTRALHPTETIPELMSWRQFPSYGLAVTERLPTLSNVWLPRWTSPFSEDSLPSTAPRVLKELPECDIMFDGESDDERGDDGEENNYKTTSLTVGGEAKNSEGFPEQRNSALPLTSIPTPDMVRALFYIPDTIHCDPDITTATGNIKDVEREFGEEKSKRTSAQLRQSRSRNINNKQDSMSSSDLPSSNVSIGPNGPVVREDREKLLDEVLRQRRGQLRANIDEAMAKINNALRSFKLDD